MRKILLLATSNIKKNKGQAVSLLVFVLIAAVLLNTGLLLMEFGKSFDNKTKELNGPHFAIVESKTVYSPEQETYLQNYPGVTETESEEVLSSNIDMTFNGGKMACVAMFAKESGSRKINPLTLVGDSKELDDTSIYVPYLMKTGGGYQLGDDFPLVVQGKKVQYTIAGFTEETFYSSAQNQWYRFYLTDHAYDKLSQQLPASMSCILHSARLTDASKGDDIQLDFVREFFYQKDIKDISSQFVYSGNYDSVKNFRVFMANITAMLFVAFTAVIVAVCLIVIRYRISNSIEEEMTNIGALKAIGYTSKQIIASVAMQFTGIALIGSVVGIAVSYLSLPALSKLLEAQTALVWKQGFDLKTSMITFLALILLVLLVTYVSARKIKKMHPLVALRGGIVTHNFRKNTLPLDQTRGKLSFLLGMKYLLQNKKQSIMIAIIIAAVSFAAASSVAIYYNMAVKPDNFVGFIAGESPDAAFMRSDTKETAKILDDIKQMPEVRKAIPYDNITVLVNDNDTNAIITDDFSQLEGQLLFEGRYPKYDNEIALSIMSIDRINKKIGDMVTITQGSKKADYLITGLIQTMNFEGYALCINTAGMKRVQSDFAFKMIYAYLKDGQKVDAFIEKVKMTEGDDFTNSINLQETIDSQFEVFGTIFTAIAAIIVGITVFVIILVLYMVIKAMLIHRKRELGIQKALGYTTFQLMQQISLSFVPVVLLGVTVGGIAGYFGFNSMFTSLVSNMGLVKVTLPTPLGLTLQLLIGLVILAYLVAMLITWRIRKISVNELVNE